VRRLLVLVVLVPAALGTFALSSGGASPPAHSAAECGVERWPVKTLSDKREELVSYAPHDTSIGRLRNKAAPDIGKNTPRIEGVETTTYRMRARLLKFKFEDDRDIHLVVGVPSSPKKTMIVEFPDPTCPGAKDSPKKARMASARSALINSCGKPPSASSKFRDLKGTATVTGVGFFDIIHGQTGVAPNGIELHPVLRISNSSCEPG
jgi:hypothetical protein